MVHRYYQYFIAATAEKYYKLRVGIRNTVDIMSTDWCRMEDDWDTM